MKYPGSKGGAGVFQTIINNIPPHDTYIETHLGGGNIFERKRPTARSIGVDVDPAVIAMWKAAGTKDLELHCADAVDFLKAYRFTGREFVYVDPPYVMQTRRGGPIYRHEYTDEDHERLLAALGALPCAVMVSGYASELYDQAAIAGWRQIECKTMTRGGIAFERLWMNYPAPKALHELSFVGQNFRDRERIKRKATRLKARLTNMEPLERAVMVAAMTEVLSELEADA